MSGGFSSSDDHSLLMDKENFFHSLSNSPHHQNFHLSTTYSTADEKHLAAGLTRQFSRSASLQQPLFNIKENRDFSGSPESGHFQMPPYVKSDEDAWNLIYAAGQVAQMKMRMEISNRGVLIPPRAEGFAREEIFRRRHFCGHRTSRFTQSAWPPPPPLQHKHCNAPVMKQGVHGGGTAVKKECAGTGVFLPRRYCWNNNPTESRKRQACSPANLPASMNMIQSSNKTLVPITAPPQIQARIINGGFVSHHEMLIGRRNAMIVAAQQQRRMETAVNNPEVLLPQEWTY